jgi:hypothetical protein
MYFRFVSIFHKDCEMKSMEMIRLVPRVCLSAIAVSCLLSIGAFQDTSVAAAPSDSVVVTDGSVKINPSKATTVIVPRVLGAPVLASKGRDGCDGTWDIAWTAVAGATSYEVWVEYPTQTAYSLLVTTTNLSDPIVHTADNATQYTSFKVQACAGTSCGTFSNILSLPYYSGCP